MRSRDRGTTARPKSGGSAPRVHVPDFVAGNIDPDPAGGCPLVFYAIDAPVRIWLSKTASGEVRIEF